MKLFNLIASTLVGLVAVPVFATPITLPADPLFIQFTDAEQFSQSNALTGAGGAPIGNRGIVQLSTIVVGTVLSPVGSDIQGGGSNVFVNGFGPQVLGIFQDHVVSTPGTPGKSDTGFLDLYWWDSNTQNTGTELNSALNLPKWGADSTTYTGFSCATGAETSDPGAGCFFLGRFDFTTGSDPGFPGISIVSAADPASQDGTAKSYLDVDTGVSGAWSSQLNTNFFTLDPCNNPVGFVYPAGTGCGGAPNPGAPGGVSYTHPTDIRLDNNFTHNGAGAWSVPGTDIIGLRSNDPGRTSTLSPTEIPEPGSLAVLGLVLAVLGGVRRWRSAT